MSQNSKPWYDRLSVPRAEANPDVKPEKDEDADKMLLRIDEPEKGVPEEIVKDKERRAADVHEVHVIEYDELEDRRRRIRESLQGKYKVVDKSEYESERKKKEEKEEEKRKEHHKEFLEHEKERRAAQEKRKERLTKSRK